ncbi:MAG: DUF2207 domain-containing protein [Gammaproteobacteria bacterium]
MPKFTIFYSLANTTAFKSYLAVVILALSNLHLLNSAYAQERVYTYSSVIKVLPNRSLDVTETITVYVENKKIRHGIYRDFETTRVNQDNKKIKVDLQILEVKRNGVREKFHTRQQENKIRVFFGSKDKIVNKGIQTYAFRYITNNQINSYTNKDEFYWNASGNKWSMPVFRVEATIILPAQVKKKSITFNAYSGYTGVNKQDYISSFANNHTVKFALNKKYLAGNGLTIAIAWPKGFLDPASPVKTDLISTQTNSNSTLNKENNITINTSLEKEVKVATVENVPLNDQFETNQKFQNNSQDSTAKDTIVINSGSETELNKPQQNSINNVPELKPALQNTNSNLLYKVSSILIEKSSALSLNNVIALSGLFLLIFYFLLVRFYLKKNSNSQDPNNLEWNENIPGNLSPASIRYIYEMGYDDRTFAIALINIAVKGHIDIINNGKNYNIERREFSAADKLSSDESLLLNTLMENKSVIQLTSKNHLVIRDAMTKHQNLLEKDHKDKYFATNKKWFNFGIIIVGLILTTIAFSEYTIPKALMTFVIISGFVFVTFIQSYVLLKLFNFYKNFDIPLISNSLFYATIRKTKEAYIFAIFAIETGMIAYLLNFMDVISIVTITSAGFVCAIFSDYLISPNSEGKHIINQIDHLKDFITHGEMLKANAQYDSIQISQKISAFDNYLPYTIALGVETEWGDHYSLLFNRNDDSDTVLGYSPHWYHGSGWKENNTTGFCESLSSKFSFSAASAAKTPKHDFDTDTSYSGVKH